MTGLGYSYSVLLLVVLEYQFSLGLLVTRYFTRAFSSTLLVLLLVPQYAGYFVSTLRVFYEYCTIQITRIFLKYYFLLWIIFFQRISTYITHVGILRAFSPKFCAKNLKILHWFSRILQGFCQFWQNSAMIFQQILMFSAKNLKILQNSAMTFTTYCHKTAEEEWHVCSPSGMY